MLPDSARSFTRRQRRSVRPYLRVGLWSLVALTALLLFAKGPAGVLRKARTGVSQNGSRKRDGRRPFDAEPWLPEVEEPDRQVAGMGYGDLLRHRSSSLEQQISLFMLWPGADSKSKLDLHSSSFLLQSFLASPSSKVAELVVLVRESSSERCASHSAWIERQESNVKKVADEERKLNVVCISHESYWKAHIAYLCSSDRWACSEAERSRLLDEMTARARTNVDELDEHLRHIRGLVFSEHAKAGGLWWGWVAPQVHLGNLQRQFPWDIAPNFDVVVPSSVSIDRSQPIELSSHLAFFQRRTSTTNILFSHSSFSSANAWIKAQPARASTISSHILSSPKTSFLAYEAHLASPLAVTVPSASHSIIRALSSQGTFSILLASVFGSSSSPFLPPADDAQATFASDRVLASSQQLTNAHRSRFTSIINSQRIPAHLFGTFTSMGRTQTLELVQAPGSFRPVGRISPPAQGGNVLDAGAEHSMVEELGRKEWFFRRAGGNGKVERRLEPRDAPHEHAVQEWAFDVVDDHRSLAGVAPAYPPRYLVKSHILAFVPTLSATPTEARVVLDEIWDPDAPALQPVADADHELKWWQHQAEPSSSALRRRRLN